MITVPLGRGKKQHFSQGNLRQAASTEATV